MRVSAQRQRPPSRERRHHRLQVTLLPHYPTRGGSRATVVGSRRERARHRGPQTRTRRGRGQTRDTGAPKPGHGGVEGKPETQGPPNQDTAGWRANPRHRAPQTRTWGETQGAPKPGQQGAGGKPLTSQPQLTVNTAHPRPALQASVPMTQLITCRLQQKLHGKRKSV